MAGDGPEHRRVHGGETLEDRDSFGRNRFQCSARVKPGKQCQCRAGRDGCRQSACHPERARQWEASKHYVVGPNVEQAARNDGLVADQVAVGELGPLGRPGRAERMQDHRVVVAGAGHRPRLPEKAARQLLERVLADTDWGNTGGQRTGGSRSRARRREDQQGRIGVGQEERDFAGASPRIHRHHNGSCVQHAVENHRELGTVRQHDPHPVTWAQTSVGEVGGEPCGVVGQLRIRRCCSVTTQRGTSGVHICRFDEIQAHIGHENFPDGRPLLLRWAPAWPPVDGISDNVHRLSVLHPTTPFPVTGLPLDYHGALGYRRSCDAAAGLPNADPR